MNNVADRVRQAIEPTVTDLGYEIVEVEYTKKGADYNLTVYIHIAGGVTLDDCEKVHLAIDPVLDELDPSEGKPYVLNVSSPGLDRPFKTQRDFERNYGEEVEVKLFAPLKGKKYYEGRLTHRDENTVTILTAEGPLKLEATRVALVRPLVKFD